MAAITQRYQLVYDDSGFLAESVLTQLQQYAIMFQSVYHVPFSLRIQSKPFVGNDLSTMSECVFLGIYPQGRQVVFRVPPLVANALGTDFIRNLRTAHFEPYFANGTWPAGLEKALNLLSARLDSVLLDFKVNE